MARKDIFQRVMNPVSPAEPVENPAGYVARSASRSIMQSFEELSKSSIVELEPDLVDTSFIADRLEEEGAEFRELVEAIKLRGQDTPILVRPHPDKPGRYQVVFGHRRLRAARELGRKVKAVVKAMPDRDHVIAQGQENAARANLSFIERTLFANAILAQGHSSETVRDALGIDETTFSKMRSVAGNIPADVIRAIGPAKNTGRDRWWQLSKLIEQADRNAGNGLIATPEFWAAESDRRFSMLFDALTTVGQPRKAKAERSQSWGAPDKAVRAKILDDGKSFTLAFKAKDAARFGAFVSGNLDRLYEAFRQAEKDK
ncbi:MAG: plasmid partitioning protein RepB [Rhizobiaceae bacterium]